MLKIRLLAILVRVTKCILRFGQDSRRDGIAVAWTIFILLGR